MSGDKRIVFCEVDGVVLLEKEAFKTIMDFYLKGHPSERIYIEDSKEFKEDIALLFAEAKGIT